MDRQFLELWGHIFLAASRNQKLFEDLMSGLGRKEQADAKVWDLSDWVQVWSSGFQSLQTFLHQAFGLKPQAQVEKDTEQQKALQEMYATMLKNWKEMINLMGVVPREDYDALVQENQELKKQLSAKQERITYLQELLQHKGVVDFTQMTETFQDVLQKQSEQFQNFMQAMHSPWDKGSGSSSDQE